MSRSGYSDDLDHWATIKWRGAVAQAIRGRRGQAFLKEMLAALDAMPGKRLIAHELKSDTGMPFHRGEVCALGAVGDARAMDMSNLDPEDRETIANAFGIARALACEIVYINDECGSCWPWFVPETPERRWQRVRDWVAKQIIAE